MGEIDYSIETQEEFLEDFGSRSLSDEELNEILIKARKIEDKKLRLIVKELQYARFLLINIVDFIADSNEDVDLPTIPKLVKSYAQATVKTNKQ